MRFVIPVGSKTRKGVAKWVADLDSALWDMVFLLINGEDDIEGAKCVRKILRYFFPFPKITIKDILHIVYPMRGWERDLGVPFPYILYALDYLKRRYAKGLNSDMVLAHAKHFFYLNNQYLIHAKINEGEASDESSEQR